MIRALAADGTDGPLRERVRPRGLLCAGDLGDPERFRPPTEYVVVDVVSISVEVPRLLSIRKRLNELMRGPGRRGMSGDVACTLDASRQDQDLLAEGCVLDREAVSV
jgi:hypothetical protein